MQISHFKYEDFKSNLEYDFDEAIMTKHNILKYQNTKWTCFIK